MWKQWLSSLCFLPFHRCSFHQPAYLAKNTVCCSAHLCRWEIWCRLKLLPLAFLYWGGLCWLPAGVRNISWFSARNNIVSNHLIQIMQAINKKCLKRQPSSRTVIFSRDIMTILQPCHHYLIQPKFKCKLNSRKQLVLPGGLGCGFSLQHVAINPADVFKTCLPFSVCLLVLTPLLLLGFSLLLNYRVKIF